MTRSPPRVATATGFSTGTPILTAVGARPVETLAPGDRIITRNGIQRVRAIWHRAESLIPVLLKPDQTPFHPNTLVHLHGQVSTAIYGTPSVLRPIHRLIDRDKIIAGTRSTFELHHMLIEEPAILYVGKLEISSDQALTY